MSSRPQLKHPASTPAPDVAPSGEVRRTGALALLLSLVAVIILLLALVAVRNRAETGVAAIAGLLPFGWAFAAGIVSSVNPCGFFMLPAYLSYQLGTEEVGFYASSALARGVKALRLGLVATTGFVVVMTIVGGFIATGGQWLVRVFPYAGVGIGVALAALGLWLLVTKRTFGILAASRVTVTPRRSVRNVFLFGIAYAIGSLSCTLPIFLLVVGGALASTGPAGSLGQFVSYALGMGTVLVAVTIGAALFRGAVARSLRAAIPHVHRVSALFLVGAGLYLVYYWVWFSGAVL